MTKVIVLGGGVAGMSAAHELIERGFEVEVYEKKTKYVGGKARSVDVPNTSIGGGQPLPGEHGFRFFPGFYRHITDTFKRIPFTNPETGQKNPQGVYDNLTNVTRCMIARNQKLPIYALTEFPKSLADLKVILYDVFVPDTGLTKDDIEFFAERVWQLATSCKGRRNDEYERLGWWEYMDANNRSAAYVSLLVEGLTRSLVAAQAKTDNVKTCGNIFLQLLYSMLDPSNSSDRVLNAPTNEAWLHPWYDYLIGKGVKYHKDAEVVEIACDKHQIIGAKIQNHEKTKAYTVTGDYYICCMPVEAFAPLISEDLLYLDSSLQSIPTLAKNVEWMNGAQYYLDREVDINPGHILFVDTPWALTGISQVQFWPYYDLEKSYNGSAKAVLSVDISDWNQKGSNGKTAKECTKEEVLEEIWHQMEESLNIKGKPKVLDKDWIVYTYLDQDIVFEDDKAIDNKEPLLVNLVCTWSLRPNSYTNVPNLMLAADYVKTNTDIATMEAANEAARRAVNDIIKKSGSSADYCPVYQLYEPNILAPFRWYDKKRFDNGLPWEKDFPWWLEAFSVVYAFFRKIF
jgi:uncharacterized protein with NAD-binding domain and iron-sulfur cluster